MARRKKETEGGGEGANAPKSPGEPCKSPPEPPDLDIWSNAERVSAPPLVRPRLAPAKPPGTAALGIARPAWEYLVRFLAGDPSKALSELGADGWELAFCREARRQERVEGIPAWVSGLEAVMKRPALS